MIDFGLEVLRTAVLVAIVALLCNARRGDRLPDASGWRLMIAGFVLLSLGSAVDAAIDIANHVGGLGGLIGIADAEVVALVANVVGYLGGFILVALGLVRWIPCLHQISDEIACHHQIVGALKASLALLNKSQKGAKIGSWHWLAHPVKRLVWCSEALARILDVGNEEMCDLMEDEMRPSIHPDDVERVMAEIDRFYETGVEFEIEYRIVRPGGEVRHVIEHGEAVLDSSGRIVEEIGTVQDITDRKRAEEALRESEARYRGLFEDSPVGIWESDWSGARRMIDDLAKRGVTDWRAYFARNPDKFIEAYDLVQLTNASQAILKLYGVPDLATLAGMYVSGVVPPDNLEGFREAIIAFISGRMESAYEARERRRDGTEITTRNCLAVPPNHHHDWSRVIYSVEDITDRKRAQDALRRAHDELEFRVTERTEELQRANQSLEREIVERKRVQRQLAQTQKMQAIGRLTGGIAHDFNNLLMIVDGYTRRAATRLDDPEAVEESLSQVLSATDKAASLTKQLLAFSRRQIMEKRVFHVAGVIGNIEDRLRQSVGEQTVLRIDLDGVDACVETDPDELSQAVINLAVNSRDAITNGGQVVVGVRLADLDEAFTNGRPDIEPGRFVEVYVKDDGAGIDEDALPHVFEPFFTTKEQGAGTGLGLAMVYGFAQQSGGAAEVSSVPGEGTTVSIYLPVCGRDPEVIRDDIENQDRGRGETILVVEDDPAILDLTSWIVEDLGYTVLTASNGMEALEVDEDHDGPIDMLLSDVVMPAMGGFELAEIICERRRDLKVLFMSGYARPSDANRGKFTHRARLLQKPVKANVLAQNIRRELDNREPRLDG